MEIINKKTAELIPYANNTRTHSDEQVQQIASSIKEFMTIDNKYAVSKCGRIFSLPSMKEISQYSDKNGYKLATVKKINLNKNGQVRVHRLIALCWIGNSDLEINHIDGNKTNNHVSNLEYVTSSENSIHAVDIGLVVTGKNHHNTKTIKLTKDGEEKIVNGVREIEALGFHAPSVHRVARGERKSIKGWEATYA
mgnify:CR=1 FL=1